MLPPLTTDRAPQPYIVTVSGCDDASIVFASKRTADEALRLQALIEASGQGTGCMGRIFIDKLTDLDLSSEFTEDHHTLVRAYRRYDLLTDEESDDFL